VNRIEPSRSPWNPALLVVAAACLATGVVRAGPLDYQMVTVRNAGNPADTTGYGSVASDYRIGRYEVTIGQYAAFLNAVAATDTYDLYDSRMGSDLNVAGIARSGAPGAHVYAVMDNGGGSANRPITYVSWFDAARFANWMANGRPTGSQGDATTEDGAYDLDGATTGDAPAKNGTNPNTSAAPIYWIPGENEWYKSAYYQPTASGGPGDGYWDFATASDAAPGNVIGAWANQANYAPGGVHSVTQSASYASTQPYLTDVGAFTGSASFCGTSDQSGNVTEWNDLTGAAGPTRGLRGGDWNDTGSPYGVSSASHGEVSPSAAFNDVGFRLAGVVPEIDPAGLGGVLALLSGALGLLERRRAEVARDAVEAARASGAGPPFLRASGCARVRRRV